MEITTTTSKGRRSPSHSLGWCGMQAFINQQRQFTMATTSINLKGWTAPLLRMVLDGTLPNLMKNYGNDHHHLKGRRSPSYYLDRMVRNSSRNEGYGIYHHLNLTKGRRSQLHSSRCCGMEPSVKQSRNTGMPQTYLRGRRSPSYPLGWCGMGIVLLPLIWTVPCCSSICWVVGRWGRR